MRAPLTLCLLLGPALVLAQDPGPASRPSEGEKEKRYALRVKLDARATLDGEPVDPNLLLGFVYGELTKFGIRVESAAETGHAGFDQWIRGQKKRWAKREPDAPPPRLVIWAREESDYNGAKFYGETQAHVFKGKTCAKVSDAEGNVLAEFSYRFEWGKAIRKMRKDGSVENRTKPGVMRDYDQFMHKTLVLGLLCQDAIRAGVPEGKRASLEKYLKKTRDFLLGALEKSTRATREGELARFLRSLPIPSDS
ncbi:MAG: hypothetical protein D6731_16375 [Planctomycetota bacterium]|nr:MAG: hypothetical protein D6731_16375 [Planctomycetota bacterium]